MNVKNIPFHHDKKGVIKLGDLSKNELCRFIADMAKQNQLLIQKLDVCQAAYANHLASKDALECSSI
jgi:hypothetical protein